MSSRESNSRQGRPKQKCTTSLKCRLTAWRACSGWVTKPVALLPAPPRHRLRLKLRAEMRRMTGRPKRRRSGAAPQRGEQLLVLVLLFKFYAHQHQAVYVAVMQTPTICTAAVKSDLLLQPQFWPIPLTWGAAPPGPVTLMALVRPSGPASISYSTSSPSRRLRNPSAWMLLCGISRRQAEYKNRI